MSEEREKERGFEVIDRRRVSREGGAATSGAGEAGTTEARAAGGSIPAGEAAGAAAGAGVTGGEPLGAAAEVSVGGILRMTIGLLAEAAWIHMGLVADPVTGQVRRRLPEARRAIDVLTDLIRHLEGEATPEEKRELQRLLADLRLNFVRQASQPEATP